jgi:uncharacterized protein HemX
MWARIVRLLAPMAVNAVAESLRARKEEHARPSVDDRGDVEPRLLALQNQIDALSQAHTNQMNEVAAVLRVVGLRSSIALWVSVVSMVMTLVLFVITLFKL